MMSDIDLLFEVGAYRHVKRMWIQHFHDGIMENDAEHSYRVIWIALTLARNEATAAEIDYKKLMTMALIHDIPEIRCGDQSIVQKLYVQVDEDAALQDMLGATSLKDFIDVFHEYKKRECIEAKIVKDADNLEVDFELAERAATGSDLARMWIKDQRPIVREKLYTESARNMYDELVAKGNPHQWMLRKNKFTENPHHSE
ncbi:MAG: HD domain-containing protein [Candidatus Magasanikbacteria bacterium]|nr:HD domain-containing protein [Candidatus Magasanikbacteria bacterium]